MNQRTLTWLLIVLVAILGGWLAAYSTSWGPVIYSDAAGYIAAARNYLAGQGLGVQEASGDFKLLTVHLPLYPFLLAWISRLGLSVVEAARWLNVALFGLTVLMSGAAILWMTGSGIAALSGCIFLVVSPLVFNVFTLAMSDALFVFLSLAGIYALLLYWKSERTWLLIGAGLLLGIASAARYIGVAYILAGAAGALLFTRRPFRQRVITGVLFGILSGLPLIAWLGWSALQPQTEPPRELQAARSFWEAITPARLVLVDLFWDWLPFAERYPKFTYRVKLFSFVTAALAVVGLLGWASWHNWRRWKSQPGTSGDDKKMDWRLAVSAQGSGVGTLALCLVAVMASVLVSYAYTRPQLDLNDRTLLPVYLLGMLFFLMMCDLLRRIWTEKKWLSWLPLVGVVVLAVSALPRTVVTAVRYHQEGDGYAGKRWQTSESMKALGDLPTDVPIITNEPSAVLFWMERPAFEITEIWQTEPEPVYTRYGDEPDDPTQAVFREQGAALVVFDEIRWQLDHLYYENTPVRVEALVRGLDVYGVYNDGGIYFYPGK